VFDYFLLYGNPDFFLSSYTGGVDKCFLGLLGEGGDLIRAGYTIFYVFNIVRPKYLTSLLRGENCWLNMIKSGRSVVVIF